MSQQVQTDVRELIDGLNEDLAHEYTAVIQYIQNAARVSGLGREVLKPLFEKEARDEINHALYLANKIVALGGVPVVKPYEVKQTGDLREMIQVSIDAEKDTIRRYTMRIEQAERAGEIGLKVKLEEMLAEETEHKEELERLLEDPRL
ncbi:bacterioferritin [Planifilum fulgidum]|jgi:bacterioferritin|uniref:Bacterioferritin n=1 Tax=Planifilum fulgidum TaxID=201973 RepID=A0A1I2KGS5_9BACL|nr:bacterioferritin [Bacillota bacterium]SFF64457.1 bacterioferritin [Planifilum fulgidum]